MKLSFFTSFASLPRVLFQKVMLLWMARMVLHTGVVLLATLLLSLFIASYGGELLPLLLLFQAIFLFLGSFASLPALRKFSVRNLLIVWLITTGVLLLFSLLFTNLFITWGILAFCLSFFLWHALVFFALYIEQIFSPEEAKITIPLIESGEPIGGIIAGLLAALGAYFIDPHVLKLIAGFLLFLGAFLIWMSSFFVEEIHFLQKEERKEKEDPKEESFFENLFEFCILALKTPLLQKLFLATLLQGMLFVVVEYQYLLAAAFLFPHSAGSIESEIAMHLTHGIGLFHILVFSFLFLVQVFFAHHIQRFLGVVKGLMLQPLALMINALGMIIFAFVPLGILGKGIYEVVGGVHKNSIASVFYAFKKHMREENREIIEGIARPLGMVLGTLMIMGITALLFLFSLDQQWLLYILGGSIIGIGILYFLIMKKASKDYTRMAERNINLLHLPEEKFDALEILSENGHENPAWILAEIIKNPNELAFVKIAALKGIAIHGDMEVFSDVLWILESSDDEDIKIAALHTLLIYAEKKIFLHYPFSRQRIIGMIEEIFETASSKRLRIMAIEVLEKLQYSEMVPFLSNKIYHSNIDTAFCSILACASFKDISVAPLLFPFLENSNSYLKSASIIALWQFSRYRGMLLSMIIEMLTSEDINMQMSGVYAVGELKIISEIPRLQNIIQNSSDIHLQKHAIIALAKMGDTRQIPALASLLFHKDQEISSSTKKLITSPGVKIPFEKNLSSFIRQKVLEEIRHVTHQKLDKNTCERLIWLYKTIGSEKMVLRLRHSLGNFIK